MSDRTCKTCRHWESRVSALENPDHPERMGECLRTRWNGSFPVDPDTKASAFPTDGGDAVLFTRRDFGCNQWEGNER